MDPGAFLINRTLERERWARDKLALHAGRTVSFKLGPASVTWKIDESGSFHETKESPDLTLTLSPLRLPSLLAQPARWHELVEELAGVQQLRRRHAGQRRRVRTVVRSVAVVVLLAEERSGDAARDQHLGRPLDGAQRRTHEQVARRRQDLEQPDHAPGGQLELRAAGEPVQRQGIDHGRSRHPELRLRSLGPHRVP